MSSLAEATFLEIPCDSRRGEDQKLRLNMLHELGVNYSLSPQKIRDLWIAFRGHDVLFSDYTRGRVEPFLLALINPQGMWAEITDESGKILGVFYVSDIKPPDDAQAHFAIWDGVASGREPVALFGLEWVMDRYHLHRVSMWVPAYQHGVLRFVERLGFQQEGVMREAVLYKGERVPLVMFGMLRDELDAQIGRIW